MAAILVVAALLWFRQQSQLSPPAPTPRPERPAVATPAITTGVFIEPGDGRQPILDEIAEARRSIDLEIYLITDEPTLRALEAAHRRGIAVRVILEQYPYGGGGRQPEIFDRLDAAGIAVRWGNPVFRFTHIKTMVIDNEVAVIMNQNLTDSSFRGNREFGVITNDPAAVRTAAAIFDTDWTRGQEPNPEPLVVSPTNARAALRDLIVSAETSLDIYAEVLRDPELLGAMTDAAARGVQVRLLVSPGPDNADARAALAAAGVQVRLLSNLYIHAKLIIADGKRVFVGSQNLSATSLDLNRELGIILDDPISLARLERTFVVDFRSATPQELP
ncbi:MAG: phospholipase D-like domain-containing protein [Thermomicrobiales bacterium]